MSNPLFRTLISEMIETYLEESYEDNLVESIFEEVSEETWEAIEEAILNELSPELLKRYRDKSVKPRSILQQKKNRAEKQWINRVRSGKGLTGYTPKDKLSDEESRKLKNRTTGEIRSRNRLQNMGK